MVSLKHIDSTDADNRWAASFMDSNGPRWTRDSEGQQGTMKDNEGQWRKTRDNERQGGTTRDNEGQRKTTRDNEGQKEATRDSQGQWETTRDNLSNQRGNGKQDLLTSLHMRMNKVYNHIVDIFIPSLKHQMLTTKYRYDMACSKIQSTGPSQYIADLCLA